MYVKWFLAHHNPAFPLHRKFLYYCGLNIERAELEGAKIPLTGMPPQPRREPQVHEPEDRVALLEARIAKIEEVLSGADVWEFVKKEVTKKTP